MKTSCLPKIAFRLLAILFSAAICLQATAAGTQRYVSTSGDDTDNDCTDSANPCGTIVYAIGQSDQGDAVQVAAGTYTEHGITVDKDLTINGHSASDTIVQAAATPGTATDRVFLIGSSTTVTISDLTITNGKHGFAGAGIDNDHATLTVSNCTISANSSPFSAGIFNDGSAGGGTATLTINNSTISGNTASQSAGAVQNNGRSGSATLTINDSTISGNFAASFGGGIFNRGDAGGSAMLTINNSTISDNSVVSAGNSGGGLYNDGSGGSATVSINNSTVSGNSATMSGGGLYNDGRSSGSAMLTVSNSTLSGNSVGSNGGGIVNIGDSGSAILSVTNCTLSGNSASNHGGSIWSGLLGISGVATLQIGSTILDADISGGNIFNSLAGTVTSLGYNLSSDDSTTYLNATGDQNSTDPMLGPLQDNGGPTFTHALLPGSPAIDQGYNFSGSMTDQRGTGFARTYDDPAITNATGGDGTDIGAFEVQAANTVCPQPQGYWKNNPDAWPVNSLMLGSQSYTKAELLTILRTPVGTGKNADASLILADQLIAAKLNIANGADGTPVTSTITHADSVLSGFSGTLPFHVKPSTMTGQAMVNDAATLESFNKGMLTPGCSQ
jgi:hypothetical protein